MRKHVMWIGAGLLLINALGVWFGLQAYREHLQNRLPVPRLNAAPADGLELHGESELTWTWNQAVANPESVGRTTSSGPLRFTPEVPGTFVWDSDRSLRFKPASAWLACQTYQVAFEGTLTNETGLVFAPDWRATLSGPPLKLVKTQVLRGSDWDGVSVLLTFNQNVDPVVLQNRLTLRAADTEGNLSYSVRETPVHGQLLLQVSANAVSFPLRLTITEGLTSVLGSGGAMAALDAKLDFPDSFKFSGLSAESPAFGLPRVYLDFSSEPDLAELSKHLRIEPEIKVSVGHDPDYWYSRHKIQLTGDFQPGRSYDVHLGADVRGLNGAALASPVVRRLTVPERTSGFRFKHSGRILNARGSRSLALELVREREIKASLSRVYDNNVMPVLLRASGADGWESKYSPDRNMGQNLWTNTFTFAAGFEGEHQLDLSGPMAGQASGLYKLELSGTTDQKERFLIVSDLGLLTRRDADAVSVWVVRFSDATPVADAEVRVWSDHRQDLGTARTDVRGLARIEIPASGRPDAPLIIMAVKDGDLGIVDLSEPERAFPANAAGRSYAGKGYEAFVYTDRGIYRHGEPIHARTIVRDQHLDAPPVFPVEWSLRAPDGVVVKRVTSTLSALGTQTISWDSQPEWPSGTYRIAVSLPGSEVPLGETAVNLEAFVPPQIVVKVAAKEGETSVPPVFHAEASATMLYGAVAAKHPASATVSVSPETFRLSEYPHHSFSDDRKPSFTRWTREVGKAETDLQGQVVFRVEIPDSLYSPSALRAVTAVTVEEFSGRGVTQFVSRRVDRSPHYLGIQVKPLSGEDGWAEIDLVAVTPDGKLLEGVHPVDLSWERVSWSRGYRRGDNGRFTYVSEEILLPEGAMPVELRDGRATQKIRVAEYGVYRCRVLDGTVAVAAATRFRHGNVASAPERADSVELKADKELYRPGEQMQIAVNAPFAGTALLTLETDRILTSQVIPLPEREAVLSLTVPEEIFPNAWVRLTVLRPQPLGGEAPVLCAEGGMPVRVNLEQRKVPLSIKVAEHFAPARKVPVRVETLPGAEVVLAGVDEGICLLTGFKTPDPFGWFTALRAAGVKQWDMFDALMPELAERFAAGDVRMGGGMGAALRRRINPVDAQRFKPLAWWSGVEVADREGVVEFNMPVPEFTGSVRWMAVVVSSNGLGHAEAASRVSRPIVVQQTVPLFMAPGDQTVWKVRLHNQTNRTETVHLNPVLSGPVTTHREERTVVLEPGEVQTLAWLVEAGAEAGRAEFSLSVLTAYDKYTETLEMAVRPVEPYRSDIRFHILPPGASREVPGFTNVLNGTGTRDLSVSRFPAVQLAGALDYLVRYPYGCLEQVRSITFPLLYVPDLARTVAPADWREGDLDDQIAAGIHRLWRMQLRDGSFSYWPGGRETADMAGIDALEFLVEAHAVGKDVDAQRLEAGLDWLERWLRRMNPGDNVTDLENMAKACAVLARAERLDAGWAQRLREWKPKLTTAARCYAAVVLREGGHVEEARDMLAGLAGNAFSQGWAWRSAVSSKALLLRVLLAVDVDDARIPGLAADILQAQRQGRWAHTYENAEVIRALSVYCEKLPVSDGVFKVRMELPGISRFVREGGTNAVPNAPSILLQNRGEAPVYVVERQQGVPLQAPAVENAFSIHRVVRKADGTEFARRSPIVQGELVLLQISLTQMPEVLRHLAISERLPAGLEPLPAAMQAKWKTLVNANGLPPETRANHMEIRDDRVLLFPGPIRGEAHFYVLTRAVTTGWFIHPAPYAQDMYDERIEARGETSSIRIRP